MILHPQISPNYVQNSYIMDSLLVSFRAISISAYDGPLAYLLSSFCLHNHYVHCVFPNVLKALINK